MFVKRVTEEIKKILEKYPKAHHFQLTVWFSNSKTAIHKGEKVFAPIALLIEPCTTPGESIARRGTHFATFITPEEVRKIGAKKIAYKLYQQAKEWGSLQLPSPL